LNASSTSTPSAPSSGFYVNPVSTATGANSYSLLMYDTSGLQIVQTSSTFQASTKTFVIDHPLDSQRFLVHGCLEGPEAGVYYRGKGLMKTGKHKTVIKLPEYTSVFKDFTVHITCVGFPVLFGASEVENNEFTVYSNIPVQRETYFNWVVYGTRNSIETEPLKNSVTVEGSGPYLWVK